MIHMDITHGWTPMRHRLSFLTTTRKHVALEVHETWAKVEIHDNPVPCFEPRDTRVFYRDDGQDYVERAKAWAIAHT
jgi:hypothetical protein